MRCLVIDDSPDDRSLVERMLKRLGWRAQFCASGYEAIEVLGSKRFDVALVDLGMPAMPGDEVIRVLRELDPEMRILVCSSFDDRQHVLGALGAGAHGYVLKYELSQKLAPAMQDLMAGRSPLSAAISSILLRKLRERGGSDRADPVPTPHDGPALSAGPALPALLARCGEIEAKGTLPKP